MSLLSRDGILQNLHFNATFYGLSGHSHMQGDGKRQCPFFALFEILRRPDAGEAHEACGIVIGHDGDWARKSLKLLENVANELVDVSANSRLANCQRIRVAAPIAKV
jgi:hypothetical protein